MWKELTTRCPGLRASKVYRRQGPLRAQEWPPILIAIRDAGMGAPEIMPSSSTSSSDCRGRGGPAVDTVRADRRPDDEPQRIVSVIMLGPHSRK
jgi:hypothetical protein